MATMVTLGNSLSEETCALLTPVCCAAVFRATAQGARLAPRQRGRPDQRSGPGQLREGVGQEERPQARRGWGAGAGPAEPHRGPADRSGHAGRQLGLQHRRLRRAAGGGVCRKSCYQLQCDRRYRAQHPSKNRLVSVVHRGLSLYASVIVLSTLICSLGLSSWREMLWKLSIKESWLFKNGFNLTKSKEKYGY